MLKIMVPNLFLITFFNFSLRNKSQKLPPLKKARVPPAYTGMSVYACLEVINCLVINCPGSTPPAHIGTLSCTSVMRIDKLLLI